MKVFEDDLNAFYSNYKMHFICLQNSYVQLCLLSMSARMQSILIAFIYYEYIAMPQQPKRSIFFFFFVHFFSH